MDLTIVEAMAANASHDLPTVVPSAPFRASPSASPTAGQSAPAAEEPADATTEVPSQDKEKPDVCHGFKLGAVVMTHGLQTKSMNGKMGNASGIKGDRVAVTLLHPIGEKTLRPTNLKLVIDTG